MSVAGASSHHVVLFRRLYFLLFLLMSVIPIRAISYNPLSSSCDDRLVDILDEAANFDFIGLNGTCKQFEDGISNCKRAGFCVYSCGFAKSPLTNKSCGVAIAIGKRFGSARVYPPCFAGGKLLAGQSR